MVIISTALNTAMLHVQRSQNFLEKACRQFRGDLSKCAWTILPWPRKVQHLGAYFAATASNVQVRSLIIWTIPTTRNYDLLIQDDSRTKCRAYELRGLSQEVPAWAWHGAAKDLALLDCNLTRYFGTLGMKIRQMPCWDIERTLVDAKGFFLV
ncbi:hypothetical protein COCNU_scaffold013090G000010 [Cocos nucifera]|nr:hypothetical protein [Cocos nucifera]